jgi:hypothetical protein
MLKVKVRVSEFIIEDMVMEISGVLHDHPTSPQTDHVSAFKPSVSGGVTL